MSSYPAEIILEVTNRCNLRCIMCHYHGIGARQARSQGDMLPDLWRKVLGELADTGEHHSLITHGAGEPLLYPHLFDLLREAKTLPNLSVGFMTNGMLLTPDISRKIIDIGVDWLAFSVDGVEQEPHARYRKNSDLDLINRNIETLINLKKRRSDAPHLSFNMVCLPELAAQEQRYVEKWLPYATQVMISYYRPVGSRRLTEHKLPETRTPCPNIFRQMVVSWEGEAALCCEDIYGDVKVGDLAKDTVGQVWNGEILREIRRSHKMGTYDRVPFCLECDTWSSESILKSEPFSQEADRLFTTANRVYKRKI